jgi:hypothetical protein
MADNNTYIKQGFEDGEILHADHLNYIEDAIEGIYSILNQTPKLSYIDEPGFREGDTKYWSLGETMYLKFKFETSAVGKIIVTVLRNGMHYKTLSIDRSNPIFIDLGVATENTSYVYSISVIDSLGREPEGITNLIFNLLLNLNVVLSLG